MIEISILKKQIKPCLGKECLRFCVLLQYEQSYKEYGFNMVISDKISLDRAVPDIRDTQ